MMGEVAPSHLWSDLLREVQNNALFQNQQSGYGSPAFNLILLGKQNSGKNSLIARLQNLEKIIHSNGLHYYYIDMRKPNSEEPMKVGAWCLDTDVNMNLHLRFALNKNTIWSSLIVICVSMAELWNAEDSISDIVQQLRSHLDYLDLDEEEVTELQESLQRQFQLYVEPIRQTNDLNSETVKTSGNLELLHRMSTAAHSSGMPANSLHPADVLGTANDTVLVPIPEGIFKEKLTVPLIILITKADVIKTLEQEAGFTDDTFDVLQWRLRAKALELGAALAYISVKANTNCELFTRYLRHRFFNTSFHSPAQVLEHETLFVPAGWDNHMRLNTLRGSINDQIMLEAEKLISSPPPRDLRMVLACAGAGLSVMRATDFMLGDSPLGVGGSEPEIVAEEEQIFLTKLYNQQQQQITSGPKGSQTSETTGRPMPTGRRPAHGTSGTSAKTPNKEAVLTNFFCSLLTKQSGSERPRSKSPLSGSTSPAAPTPPRASPLGDKSVEQEHTDESPADTDAKVSSGERHITPATEAECRQQANQEQTTVHGPEGALTEGVDKDPNSISEDSSTTKDPVSAVDDQQLPDEEYRLHEGPVQLTQRQGVSEEGSDLTPPDEREPDCENSYEAVVKETEDSVLASAPDQAEDREEVEVFNRKALKANGALSTHRLQDDSPVASGETSTTGEPKETSDTVRETVAENKESTSTNAPTPREDVEGFGRMQVCPEVLHLAPQSDNDVDGGGQEEDDADFGDSGVPPVASAAEGSTNDDRLEVSDDCGEPVAENKESTSTNAPTPREDVEGFGRMQVCPEVLYVAPQSDNDVDGGGQEEDDADFGDSGVPPVASAAEGSTNDDRLEVSDDCGEPVAENKESTSTNAPTPREDVEGFGRMQVCPEVLYVAPQSDNDVDGGGQEGDDDDFGDSGVPPVASAAEGSTNDDRLEVSDDCGEPVAENKESTSTNAPTPREDVEGFGRMQVCPEVLHLAPQSDNDVDGGGQEEDDADFGDSGVPPVASAAEGSTNDDRLEVSDDCGEPVKGDQNSTSESAPDQSENGQEVEVLDRQTLDNIAIVTLGEIPKDDGSNRDEEHDDVPAADGSPLPEGSTSGEQKEVPDHKEESVTESEKSSVANAEAEVTPNQEPYVNEDSLGEGEGRKETEEIVCTPEPEGAKDNLHPEVLGLDQTDQSQVT
ncbi:Cytoplasmic dynein 1 light intermediate chain 1 [Sparganum proliferum]